MPSGQGMIDQSPAVRAVAERRGKPRVCVPFPAIVRGVDDSGKAFQCVTVVDNTSADGLYVRLMPCVKNGTPLDITLRMSTARAGGGATTRVVTRGVVVRSETIVGGACGVAVAFIRRSCR
ncbi:MAG: PilZ domain-containing protein [Acidobacteriota bacterium]|nr:PilZ domain-containing protein [Acidobacteriota bacterium]